MPCTHNHAYTHVHTYMHNTGGTRKQRLQLLFYLCLPPKNLEVFMRAHPGGGLPTWLLEVGGDTIISLATLTHYYHYGRAFVPGSVSHRRTGRRSYQSRQLIRWLQSGRYSKQRRSLRRTLPTQAAPVVTATMAPMEAAVLVETIMATVTTIMAVATQTAKSRLRHRHHPTAPDSPSQTVVPTF